MKGKLLRIGHSHTASAVGNLEKVGPRSSFPRDQINKIILAQNGVGVSLRVAGLQLVPNHPFCLSSQPTAWDNSQTPIRGVGYEEKGRGKTLPRLRCPPTERSGLWVGSIHAVLRLIFFHSRAGNIIITQASLKRKLPPYPGHLQTLEILGLATQINHTGRDFPQNAPMRLDRAVVGVLCLAPPRSPSKREEGVTLCTPD